MARDGRIVGPGRAGTSLARALTNAGWDVAPMLGRRDPVTGAAHGVDLLVLATPDDAIRQVARAVEPDETTVVAHLAGARGHGREDEAAPVGGKGHRVDRPLGRAAEDGVAGLPGVAGGDWLDEEVAPGAPAGMRLAGYEQHAQLVAHAIDGNDRAIVDRCQLALKFRRFNLDDVRSGMRDVNGDPHGLADGHCASFLHTEDRPGRGAAGAARPVTGAPV